jgi:hypothetical protein
MKNIILCSVLIILLSGCGEGALERTLSVAGVATVKMKDEPVTCFIEAQHGSISCLPNWFINYKGD